MIKANQLLCIIHCVPLGLIFLYVIMFAAIKTKIKKGVSFYFFIFKGVILASLPNNIAAHSTKSHVEKKRPEEVANAVVTTQDSSLDFGSCPEDFIFPAAF